MKSYVKYMLHMFNSVYESKNANDILIEYKASAFYCTTVVYCEIKWFESLVNMHSVITLHQMASEAPPQLPLGPSWTFLLCCLRSRGFDSSHWPSSGSRSVLSRRKCPRWPVRSGSRWMSGRACYGRAERGRRKRNTAAYRSYIVFTWDKTQIDNLLCGPCSTGLPSPLCL